METYDYKKYCSVSLSLFSSDQRKGALAKFAKARKTWYEIVILHGTCGVSWYDIDPEYRFYFRLRFLDGKKLKNPMPIDKVPVGRFNAAVKKLSNAVGFVTKDRSKPTGCNKRCRGLVEQIIEMDNDRKVDTIPDVDKFLDRLTFDLRRINGEVYYIDQDFRRLVLAKIENAIKENKEFALEQLCEEAWQELKKEINGTR